MSRRLRPWLCLGLCLAASCERPDRKAPHADDGKVGPRVTHSEIPRLESSPDSRTALAAAKALAEPQAREKALAQVAWNALEQDEPTAREAFDRLAPDSPQRIALIQHFAMRMADEDPEAALAWSATLASENETAAARARIALVIAPDDPARAANLLSESGLPSREFDVAIVQVLRHWAGQSPPDAAAWVAVFPEGGFRKAGVETIINQWTASDPRAAISWLSSLGDDGVRAEAVEAIGKAMRQQNAETREAWLQAADADIRAVLEQAAAR